MQDSFTIQQELRFKDFLGASLYYFFTWKILRPIFLLVCASTIFSIFSDIDFESGTIGIKELVMSFAPIIILCSILFLVCFFICIGIYKSKPYLFKNVSYDFSHWGIIRHGENTAFSKPWRQITKLKETRSFFFFYIDNVDFHIIQKRMFTSPEELAHFKQFLKLYAMQ